MSVTMLMLLCMTVVLRLSCKVYAILRTFAIGAAGVSGVGVVVAVVVAVVLVVVSVLVGVSVS